MTNSENDKGFVSGGSITDREPRTCYLAVAYKTVPADAVFVSLRIKDTEVVVRKSEDVLTWVCKMMIVYRPTQFMSLMRTRKLSWLRPHRNGMSNPYRIAHNCFVNLDGSGKTPLLRAAKMLEWFSWPKADALLSYSTPGLQREQKLMAEAVRMKGHKRAPSESEKVERAKVDSARKFSYKFDNVNAVTGTNPISLFFKGREYPLHRRWANLPVKICVALESMWPGKIKELVAKGGLSIMSVSKNGMRRGEYVPEAKIWYEKNSASREFVRQTRKLCRLLGVNLADVSVSYVPQSDDSGEQNNKVVFDEDECASKASPRDNPVGGKTSERLDLVSLLSNVPVEDLVRMVIIETMKRGIDHGEDWDNLQNLSWCRRELGIRNALLRSLKIWETAGEYSQTYVVLDRLHYDRYLVLKYLTGFNVPAFLKWVQRVGLQQVDICKIFDIASPVAVECISVPQNEESKQRESMADVPTMSETRDAEPGGGLDKRSLVISDYIAKNPGCAKQKAIDDLSDAGISKVLTRLERHPDVMEVEGRLYVKESIIGFEDAARALADALDALFAANGGYTSAHELYQTVQLKLDDFFYDNDAFESEGEVFDIAAFLFGKEGYKGRHHIFRGGTHIWREEPDYPMADHGLLIHWARLNGGVLTRQIGYDNLERRGAVGPGKSAIFTLAMQKVKNKFWALSSDEFLLKEGVDISTEFLSDVKLRLDELLAIEEREDGVSFIPMGVVGDDFFASLPTLPGNRPWSIQLLQEVIADHGGKLHYKTIARSSFTGQAHAAIVPDGCECQDFSDLVYAAIKARNNKPSISFGRIQFVEFLKSIGLYPEDMVGSSIENMFNRNGHFKWLDRNNLVVS